MNNHLYPDQAVEARTRWMVENGFTEEDLDLDTPDDNSQFRNARHTRWIKK